MDHEQLELQHDAPNGTLTMERSFAAKSATRTYYLLTKPGIVLGNAITACAGFLLAAKNQIDFSLFLATVVGLSLTIASACVFNNYIDRVADEKMARTKNRPLVKGWISPRRALEFATVLLLCGVLVLAFFTNLLALSIALIGFFVYVVLYSFLKYHSTYGTLIGSIAGAVPPVVGYTAASYTFDAAALILFSMLVFWQMPHFYSIALYRMEDYTAASIPVLPLQKGAFTTKIHMLLYIIAFIIASCTLALIGSVSNAFIAISLALGVSWLWLCLKGFKCASDKIWARKMFTISLFVIMGISIAIPFCVK